MRALVLCFLLTLPALAKDKPQYSYQDGILQSFRTEHTGTRCSETADTSGSVSGLLEDDGAVNGTVQAMITGISSCIDQERALYAVHSGPTTYVLTPDHGAGAKTGEVLSMGWSAMFVKSSVMANREPGTTLLLRGNGKHYYVKIGNRESMYAVVDVR